MNFAWKSANLYWAISQRGEPLPWNIIKKHNNVNVNKKTPGLGSGGFHVAQF
jgi:hypothetical protein